MKFAALFIALVAAEKMTTEVAESSNMHYITNRGTRNQACVSAAICRNPYCSLYDCYEKNDKPLCAGETKDVRNTPQEAKVGIHHNIKESVLRGWRVRLHEKYSAQHGRDMRTVINDWNTPQNWMFIAAQYAGDRGNDYYIGAFAPTRRVFSRCNNNRHCGYRTLPAADCIHGAYWYCVVDWSFGYSAHNQVRLCSADTFGVWDNNGGNHNNHRLSWHMHYWYTAGWRAGMAHNMNSESNMYKLVFTKQCNSCGVVPTPRPTAYPTRYPTRFPTAAPTGVLSLATCKYTTCEYDSNSRKTTVFTNKKARESNWHCEKTDSGCKCVCDATLKCAIRHKPTKSDKLKAPVTNYHC